MSTKRRQRKSTGSTDPQNDTAFYQALLDNPETRALVFQLLSQEKEAVAEYQRNEVKKLALASSASPLKRVKQNAVMESPTAMMRRRALEKMRVQESQSSSSEISDSGNEASKFKSATPAVPFESLLEGVIAYVEIRSRDMDRSTGTKALMMAMGATVRETFTRDVTHVVFKDGLFTTYQKARLLKVHLVSVLWLEAVRRNRCRVPEKNFPAIGSHSYDRDVSNICSQLQREYEEVVREDARRSLALERPSSVRKMFSNRRRTIMTPFQSFRSEEPPLEALVTSTRNVEVENIITQPERTFRSNLRSPSRLSNVLESHSPEITSDESNCGIIDGESSQSCSINVVISETPENMIVDATPSLAKNYSNFNNVTKMDVTSMALTMIENNISSDDPVEYSGDSKSLIGGVRNLVRKSNFKAASNDKSPQNVVESSLGTYNEKQFLFTTPKSTRISSDKFTNISSDASSRKLSSGMYTSIDSSSTSLKEKSLEDKENVKKKISNKQSKKKKIIVSSNILLGSTSTSASTRESMGPKKGKRKSSGSSMSSLRFSGSKDSLNTVSSTLSNLQISIVNQKNNDENADTSKATSMSSLRISNESKDIVPATSTDMEICPAVSNTNDESTKNLQNESAFTDKSSNGNSFNKEGIEDALDILEKDINSDKNNDQKKRKSTELEDNEDEIEVTTPSNGSCNQTSPLKINDAFVTRRSKRLKYKIDSTAKIKNQYSSPAHSKTYSFKKNDDVVISETVSESSQDSQPDISGVKQRKMRRLYNPDDSIQLNTVCNEEEERLTKRKEAEEKIRKNVESVAKPTGLAPIPSTVKAKGLLENKLTENSPRSANLNIEKSKTTAKKKKAKKEKSVKHDSSADEQKLLAQEVFDRLKKDKESREKPADESTKAAQKENKDDEPNFKTPRTRKSMRLSQQPRIKYTKSQGYVRPAAPPIRTPNRRSTLDFQVKTPVTGTKKKQKLKVVASIVCTKLHKEECQVFMQIVKKLGRFVLEDEVSERTTHLVVGDSKRTMNMLRAIARGCWVIRYEWVLKSLEAGKWLPEEDYEVTEFSPVVQQCRLQRQAFGPTYSMDIFTDCGPIYVAPHSTPRCSDLQELVRLCKGTVATGIRGAQVVVGMFSQGVPACVRETWVLDCITENRCKHTGRYRMKP